MAVCLCGRIAVSETCWTSTNPGRRVWVCPQPRDNRCQSFLGWKDPPMCARSVEVIPGLVQEKKMMEDQVIPNLVRSKMVEVVKNKKLSCEVNKLKVVIKVLLLVIITVLIMVVAMFVF